MVLLIHRHFAVDDSDNLIPSGDGTALKSEITASKLVIENFSNSKWSGNTKEISNVRFQIYQKPQRDIIAIVFAHHHVT